MVNYQKRLIYSYGIVVLEIMSDQKSIDVKVFEDDSEDNYLLRQERNFP